MTVSRRLIAPVVVMVSLAVGAQAREQRASATKPNLIQGSDLSAPIVGTSADDEIYGRAGDDRIGGGGGNDDLDGGPGADDMHGGPGNDAASYPPTGTGVDVTLDDRPNDGAPGEGDNVHSDVEAVYGGNGDDHLVGDAAANTLDGGGGEDTIVGGHGLDGLYGGAGRDKVEARDGELDVVDCGPGMDRAELDLEDEARRCERTNVKIVPIRRSVGVPAGVSTREACRGDVHMEFYRGSTRIGKATTVIRPDCEYAYDFRVLRSTLGRAKTLKVVVRRITGNDRAPTKPFHFFVDIPRTR
jgi:hypothetical protein